MLRKLLLFPLAFFVLGASMALAQTGTLEGTVIDEETGEPVPTANVFIMELQRGATTNLDGEFRIGNIPVGNYRLRVTFVGYRAYRQEITIEANQTLELDIELEQGAIGLDDVVVTGYGIEAKREATTGISKVSSEEFEKVPFTNTESILQGRAAGVQVNTTSGEPGGGFQVRVRGAGSINAGADPLYIVDGTQISFSNLNEQGDTSPLNSINPNDIESIEVLKDGAAAAIYGAQAANGVVIITTKRGSEGETKISLNSEWGVFTSERRYDFLDAEGWFEIHSEGWENFFQELGFPEGTGTAQLRGNLATNFGVDPNFDPATFEGFDWQDFVFKEGFGEEYSMTVSGGDETTRFFVSGGYTDRAGHVIKSNFEQFRIRTNIDHRVSDKLDGSISTNISTGTQTSLCQDGFFINCPISGAAFQNPFTKPFNDDGSFDENTNFGLTSNPAVVRDEVDRENNVTQINGNITGTYRFTDWLNVRTLWGLDWRTTRDRDDRTPIATGAPDFGSINPGQSRTLNWNTNTVINATQNFGDHNLKGLAGMEYRREKFDEIEFAAIGLPSGLFDVASAAATPDFTQGFDSEFRLASYFGKIDYNYQEKYLLSFSARGDGSSRFGEENRWGIFPAVSAAWRISEEGFFNADWVDELKVRGSWSTTGNQSIGDFAARGLFGVQGSFGGVASLRPTQLANPDLTWEERKEFNVGLDFSLFRGRLSGSFNAFTADNEDLLLGQPLPRSSGFTSITENVGEVETKGLELEVDATVLDRNDLLVSVNANISAQKNEITELIGDQDQLNTGTANTFAVGKPLGIWNVPVFAGINPADGRPLWFDKDGNLTSEPTTEDSRFKNGGEEDFTGGFGTNISYRRISLNAFFQWSVGGQAMPSTERFFLSSVNGFNMNTLSDIRNRWQEPGDIAPFPKLFLGDDNPTVGSEISFFNSITHTGLLEKTNYLRLKNLNVSYDLPKLPELLGVRNIEIYFTGVNLVTIDDFSGLDPEIAGARGRRADSSIPTARQFFGGLNIDF